MMSAMPKSGPASAHTSLDPGSASLITSRLTSRDTKDSSAAAHPWAARLPIRYTGEVAPPEAKRMIGGMQPSDSYGPVEVGLPRHLGDHRQE